MVQAQTSMGKIPFVGGKGLLGGRGGDNGDSMVNYLMVNY